MKKPTKNSHLQMRVTHALNKALGFLAEAKSYDTGENITKSRLVADALIAQYPELKGLVREIVAQEASKS